MRANYDDMTDEEICRCINDGESDGIDYLLDKYKGTVRIKARSFYLIGGDNDDLIQEGMIGLMRAVRSFNPDKESSFAAFADMCINRQIYSAVKASQRKKHSPLNSYISLYQPAADDENAPALMDVLPQTVESPEDALVGKEIYEQLWERLDKELSPLERKVLALFMEGMGYAAIARQLGKDGKAVDNALQRIRQKASKICK